MVAAMADPISGVNSSSTGGTTTTQTTERTIKNELGKDDFLKLLIAQLTNQDPLDPLKDQDFIAQLAQFTALEQTTNMAKGIETLTKLSMTSAVGYVGRVVGYTDDEGNSKAGTVQYVEFKDGAVTLKLTDGSSLALDKVEQVA